MIFVLAISSNENRALLDRARLELIRRDAVLALMSRAHVVDFDVLTELLYVGRFKAAIDVFPKEPVPADYPIRDAPGAVLATHRAGTVREDSVGAGPHRGDRRGGAATGDRRWSGCTAAAAGSPRSTRATLTRTRRTWLAAWRGRQAPRWSASAPPVPR